MARFSKATNYQLVSIALIVVVVVVVGRFVPVYETLGQIQQKLAAGGIAAPLAYPAVIAACNLLLMPGGILSAGGGFFFGLWWGFLLVLIGNMASAAAAFGIARKLGRARMERYLRRRAKWAQLDQAVQKDGWKIVLLSQLHPLFPVSLINYLYGVTGIRFWPCLLWTAVGRSPGIFLYVYLGTLGQFGMNLLQGKSHPGLFEYVFWIGGLGLLFALTLLLSRLALRILAQGEQKTASADVHS